MATETTSKQRVFGPDRREGKWWLFAYVGGLQKEWGPYATESFANGARAGLEKVFAEQDTTEALLVPPRSRPKDQR